MKFIVTLLIVFPFYGETFAMGSTSNKITLIDNGLSFDVTTVDAPTKSCRVLFAVGSGGNPERHLPLLNSLAECGCTVIAPHFERLAAARPTSEELLQRARRLNIALNVVANSNLPVYGVGHSIGATILLVMAGGQIWMGPGQRLSITPDEHLSRLVLMTPPTGFFQTPSALSDVHIPIQVWAGRRRWTFFIHEYTAAPDRRFAT
ncbi:MAG: hypothetical protein NTV34_08315 [Proteobacteria bacterium]|nr:hypothetical protein [Pseudomonadota bacterium]